MRQVHGEQTKPCDESDTTLERSYILRTHRETTHEEENKSKEQGEVPGGSTKGI